jgi:hypothetical protein
MTLIMALQTAIGIAFSLSRPRRDAGQQLLRARSASQEE